MAFMAHLAWRAAAILTGVSPQEHLEALPYSVVGLIPRRSGSQRCGQKIERLSVPVKLDQLGSTIDNVRAACEPHPARRVL